MKVQESKLLLILFGVIFTAGCAAGNYQSTVNLSPFKMAQKKVDQCVEELSNEQVHLLKAKQDVPDRDHIEAECFSKFVPGTFMVRNNDGTLSPGSCTQWSLEGHPDELSVVPTKAYKLPNGMWRPNFGCTWENKYDPLNLCLVCDNIKESSL